MTNEQATWFETITGFREGEYATTRGRLSVEGSSIVRMPDRKVLGSTGRFETPSLSELRARAATDRGAHSTVRCLVGEARALHREAEFVDGLFQVASQFNCLEMVGPGVTPEHGVTRYIGDRTQGPACAIAAGLGTIYRNYLVPIDGQTGQTADCQIDNLADLGWRLSGMTNQAPRSLWSMRNGYCEASAEQLRIINQALQQASGEEIDSLRAALRIGLHHDVEVTDVVQSPRPTVTQAYCSALAVAYSRQPPAAWQAFARLVLEASYEATLLAAAERTAAGHSNVVLLTRVGGGAFGNADAWITDAVVRALRRVEFAGLDVRLVNYGTVNPEASRIAEMWADGRPGNA